MKTCIRGLAMLLVAVMLAGAIPTEIMSCGAQAFDSSLTKGHADNIVEFALSQKGKIGSDYAASHGIDFNWCVWFTTLCASEVGICGSISNNTGGIFPPLERSTWAANNWAATGVPYQAKWFTGNNKGKLYYFNLNSVITQNSNTVSSDRNTFVPQKGDLIYFNNSSKTYSHVAIVYDYNASSGTVYYIGGNQENKAEFWETSIVSKRSCSKTSTAIAGYLRPNYSNEATTPGVSSSDLNAQTVVDLCLSKVGTSYTDGFCLRFVKEMFQSAYGFSSFACCAYKYGSSYIDSSSRDNIPLGASVFFAGSTSTCSTCKNKCGHIGIYVGDDCVVHAWAGKIVKYDIDRIINAGYPYRGWGWHGNYELSHAGTDIYNPDNYPIPTRNLYSGLTGDDVKWLQAVLYQFDYYNDSIDGSYGPATVTAVKAFQSDNGLDTDGKAGPATQAKLKEKWAGGLYSSYTYSFSFNANGGVIQDTGAFTCKYKEDFYVENNTCTNKGYDFAGWNVKRNSDNAWYIAGVGWCSESIIADNGYTKKNFNNHITLTLDDSWVAGIKADQSFTFCATWVKIDYSSYTYSFSFNANGGVIGDTGEFSCQYGSTFRVENNTCTNNGFDFAGWNIKRNSDNAWAVSGHGWLSDAEITQNNYQRQNASNGTTFGLDDSWTDGIKADQSFTFCATWVKNGYTVTFFDSVTNQVISTQIVGKGSNANFPTPPTHDGYNFTGWDKDGNNITADTTITALYNQAPAMAAPTFVGIAALSDKDFTCFQWYAVENATAYDLRIFSFDNTSEPVSVHFGIRDTFFKLVLPAGTYCANVTAVNENFYHSWSLGELSQSFTVEAYNDFIPTKTVINDGHMYSLYDYTFGSWEEARLACEKLGGHLVTITNETEQAVVHDLFAYSTKSNCWIGATDEAQEGTWTWITGEDFNGFTNWDENEPNNDCSIEHYGMMSKSGLWNDDELVKNDFCVILEIELDAEPVNTYKIGDKAKYEVFYKSMSWTEAKTYCEYLGGHLVTITSAEENVLVYSLINKTPENNCGYFMGGCEPNNDGVWQWVTGEAWDYANWNTEEPNNCYGIENYLQLSTLESLGGTWNDSVNEPIYFGAESVGFICEYEMPTYTVMFADGLDNTVISTQSVAYGSDATLPAPPAHEGYTFTGWNSDGKNITCDTLITAQYSKTVLVGDINNDGKITIIDALLILRKLAGWDIEVDAAAADVNGDTKVTTIDALLILRHLAGWEIEHFD